MKQNTKAKAKGPQDSGKGLAGRPPLGAGKMPLLSPEEKQALGKFVLGIVLKDVMFDCNIPRLHKMLETGLLDEGKVLIMASRGLPAVVSYLLRRGISPNATSGEMAGFPLLAAASEGFHEVVKLLLDAGADPNQKDKKYGSTALHMAAQPYNGLYNSMTMLALRLPKSSDNLETIRLLVEAGAELSPKNKDGLTPLAIAEHNKCHDTAALLRELGAEE